METLYYSDSSTRDVLHNLYESNNLIPFIGSGFSQGSDVKGKQVPDGGQLKNMMKESIKRSKPDKFSLVADTDKFSDIAKYYLKYVPREIQLNLFLDYFVDVDLDEERACFLKAGWPYIYTLNIDDGIERVLNNYEQILSYKKLNSKFIKTIKCIFKLHGDARFEVKYPDEKNIVFSSDQYLLSLRDNSDLLSMIQSDYKTKSVLIIGCSLDDEIDLKYAVLTNDGFDTSRNYRFYVTQKIPSEDKIERLEDLGVNKIVIVEDYVAFYKSFASVKKNDRSIIDSYKFTGYDINILKEDNIDYFLGQMKLRNKNKIVKYKIMVDRDKETSEWEKIKKSNTVLVVGRRVSGKTTFLINLLNYLSLQDIYFFSSQIIISIDFMKEIELLTNSVIVFDSNSISPDNITPFVSVFNKAKLNNNKIIVAANKSDKLFIALFTRLDFDSYVEIKKYPTSSEAEKINKVSAEYGIPNIRQNVAFIDNIAYLNKTFFRNRRSVFPQILSTEIKEVDSIILILLASINKVYYITLQHFDISIIKLYEFANKYAPAVEVYRSLDIEEQMHSGIKIIANSKYWIISKLANICRDHKELIINSVVEIVNKLYFTRDSSYCAKQVLLFDNLNAIFSLFDSGVRHIPYVIYENLSDVLKEEPDYWLQRAKSVFNLSSNIKELENARDYAYKAYLDFEAKEKYSEKAALTLAMICGKICRIDNYKNIVFVEDAIDWYYQSLISEKNNDYSDSLIAKAKSTRNRSDLYCLGKYLLNNSNKYISRKAKINTILTQLLFI